MKKIIVLMSIIVVTILIYPSFGHSGDWRRMHKSDFPAKVRSVSFKYTLDATHTITFGKWTVAFSSEPPIAKVSDCAGCEPGYLAISISGLVCSNEIEGTPPCNLELLRDGSRSYCSIDKIGFVTCPSDLTTY